MDKLIKAYFDACEAGRVDPCTRCPARQGGTRTCAGVDDASAGICTGKIKEAVANEH